MIDEDVLISMLNSDNENDINLALGIVNGMESNTNLINKLIEDRHGATWEENIKWYKSTILTSPSYFRKDYKGKGLLFRRGKD